MKHKEEIFCVNNFFPSCHSQAQNFRSENELLTPHHSLISLITLNSFSNSSQYTFQGWYEYQEEMNNHFRLQHH